MNVPTPQEARKFDMDMFRYYRERVFAGSPDPAADTEQKFGENAEWCRDPQPFTYSDGVTVNFLDEGHYHHILNSASGEWVADVIYQPEDPNRGLPDWFFKAASYTSFEVNETADTVTWTPAMGPAPCWTQPWSEVKDSLFRSFMSWFRVNY